MPILNNTARYEMRIDGYKLSYTSTGLVVDHLTARVRGCAVQIDDQDAFCDHLRQLKRGEIVLLNLRSSNGEVDYNGEAEAILIRERFSRRDAPAVTFIFRMLKYRVPSGT